jgi:hypothetical protein
MMGDLIDKELAMNSLSNEAALHIGHHDNDSVDLAGFNKLR